MLKIFGVVLLTIPMSVGSVHAMTMASRSLSHAHFPTCSDGLVKANCVCRAGDKSRRFVLCSSGRYCHTFNGTCSQ